MNRSLTAAEKRFVRLYSHLTTILQKASFTLSSTTSVLRFISFFCLPVPSEPSVSISFFFDFDRTRIEISKSGPNKHEKTNDKKRPKKKKRKESKAKQKKKKRFIGQNEGTFFFTCFLMRQQPVYSWLLQGMTR